MLLIPCLTMDTSSSAAVAVGCCILVTVLHAGLLQPFFSVQLELERIEPTRRTHNTSPGDNNYYTAATNISKHSPPNFGVAGLDGEWVHIGKNNNRSFDSPECCDWSLYKTNAVEPNCNMTFTQYMEWENSSNTEHGLYTGSLNYPAMIGYKGCACHDFVDEYEWQSPTLPPFNATETCRMLGKRTVLYIGDSTAHEAASTLMNSFRPAGETCQTQITFALSDTLIGRKYGALNRGRRWTTRVEMVQPDIIILSVGAHIVTNDTIYMNVIDQVFSEIEAMKKNIPPHVKFAWQTQVPAGCSEKITSPQNVNFAGELSMELSDYNHGQFYQRDLMLISRLQAIGMPYMDLRMLYSRTDSHINGQTGAKQPDCLHVCVPGPLDVMGRLFQKLLVEFDSS